jgi:hypothetical protein
MLKIVILAATIVSVSLILAGCAFDSLKLSVDKGSLISTNVLSEVPKF